MPTLDTPDQVRDFLRLCLTPRAEFPGRTVKELANVMPAWLVDKLAVHAPRIAALREVADHAHAAYLSALTDWVTTETAETPATTAEPATVAPAMCTQNLVGDRAVPGEHYRPDPSGPCTFCQSGRTYAFNAESVNRHVKHAHRDGRTLCPQAAKATAPMTDDQATRLPLCDGCRRTLTKESTR